MRTGIVIGETTYLQGIASGTLYLEKSICDRQLDLGLPIANRFEVQMYNVEDVSGQSIEVYQIDDNDMEYPLFSGTIESAKLDALGNYRNIVAYDAFYYKRNVDVSYWWETFWQLRTSATIKELRQSLLDYIQLEEADDEVELLNDSIIVTKNVEFKTIPFGDMLHLICQIQAVFPNIDYSGKVEYITPATTATALTSDDYKAVPSKFEEFSTPTYGAIKIYSGDTMKYVYGAGIAFVITDNILITQLTDEALNGLCANILSVLANIVYNPCDIEMIETNTSIQLGDKITSEKGTHFAFTITTKGIQFLEQRISCKGTDTANQSPVLSLQYLLLQNDISEMVEQGSMRYYEYRNGNVISIGDNQRRRIVNLKIASTKITRVDIHIEVNLASLSIPEITEGTTIIENFLTKAKVEYIIDSEIQPLTPQETYVDGNHVLHLMYILSLSANVICQYMVYMTSKDGAITIPRHGVWLYASGLGIVGDGTWDGTLDIEDETHAYEIVDVGFADASDTVAIVTQTPVGGAVNDTVQGYIISEVDFADDVTDAVRITMYNTAYERGTEDESDNRIIEDVDGLGEYEVRYTEEEIS